MAEGAAERFFWIDHGDRRGAQLDAIAPRGNPVPKLVVVAEMVHDRFEPSDFGPLPLRGGHNSPEHEIEVAHEPCHQYARRKIGAIAERFEVGGERAIGQPAIETGHPAHLRLTEWTNDRAEKGRIDAHVTIAHNDDVVESLANHAAKLVDLVARSQRLRPDQKANGTLREIPNQLLDDRNGRFVVVRHAEQDLEFRILLPAEARIIFVRLAVETADRFQDADRRSES